MEVVYQRETSLARRNLTASMEHATKLILKVNYAIQKIVLVRLANGAKANGHHVLRLVVTRQNKGKLIEKRLKLGTNFSKLSY